MELDMTIEEDILQYLSQPAKDELMKLLNKHCKDIIAEANRLEAAAHSGDGDPEITATMIRDADIKVKRYPSGAKKSTGYIIIQVLASVFTLATGGMFDINNIQKDAVYLVVFILVLSAALVFNILQIAVGGKNG